MNRSIARFWPRFALALCLLAPGAAAAQQAPSEWDPARMHVTRAELEDLLARYDAVAQSSAYSGGVRQNARESADRLRQRLEVGDFGVGDRIWLVVDGEEEIPDTLVVEPGPAIMLPNIGSISLRGVLRSELHPYLVRELERYIQKPQVRTASTIRLQIQGAVGTPGFHTFPSDMLLSDALMVAGGPSRNTDWDDLELKRGSETLMEGDDVQGALAEGRSLDHLGLRAGDIVVVPEETQSRVWPMVIRYGVMITSVVFFGFRIF